MTLKPEIVAAVADGSELQPAAKQSNAKTKARTSAGSKNKVLPKAKELLEIERYERACLASGKAGLLALRENHALAPELLEFYRLQIWRWIERELQEFAPQVTASKSRFIITFANSRNPNMKYFQLRFVPSRCKWLLLYKKNHRLTSPWWPHLPANNRHCLSLTDWLGQIRQMVTNLGQ